MNKSIEGLAAMQGIAAIAGMTTLKKVTLIGCLKITDTGFEELASLTRLQELHVMNCQQLTGKGMRCLQHFPELHSLTVVQCPKVCRFPQKVHSWLCAIHTFHCWPMAYVWRWICLNWGIGRCTSLIMPHKASVTQLLQALTVWAVTPLKNQVPLICRWPKACEIS